MGISMASGLPVASGIHHRIVGGLVVGTIAGSPLQVSGPAAGLAVLVLQFGTTYGREMLGVAVLFAGVFQQRPEPCALANGSARSRRLSFTACWPVSAF